MNERIKELLEQSGLQPYYDAQEGHIEKFAELIVKECMSISSNAMTDDNWPPHMIAKHFGVEE